MSCGQADSPQVTDGNEQLRYARNFKLSGQAGRFRIQLSDGSVFIFASDKSAATAEAGRLIRTPVGKLVCSTTTQLPWFTAVGAGEVIAGFPNTGLVHDRFLRARIDEGFVKEVAGPASFDDELILVLEPEVILADQSIRVSNRLTTRFPVLITSESTEPHPLGRAEWIKLGGILTGRSSEADSIFRQVEQRYLMIVADTTGLKVRPEVITGVPYGGTWFLPGGGSFMSRLLLDAGFRLSWPLANDETQRPTALEQVLAGASGSTCWIGSGSYSSISELLASDSRLGGIPALKSGNVFTYNPSEGAGKGNPYFEEAVIRPDLLLEDLVKIRKGEYHDLNFFRRLPQH